jgi:ppGpp synthetase/RelA/SpoT-type nucleotidyltranferase
MNSSKKPEWFYRSRVKELESFAQKLETGRVDNPSKMEDFFACTLVVENRSSIRDAVDLVERYCEILQRRPPTTGHTHKRPESFAFDDLRLYATLKSDDMTRPNPLNETPFEVQIKTFLQYAWGIATHDLVYKGDKVDWARARIAFQIKAMLEHAEVSIEKAGAVAQSDALAMRDTETQQLLEVLAWVEKTWDDEVLPRDKVRLSSTLNDLIQALDIGLEDLEAAVQTETAAGRGTVSLNLSPYGIAVQALAGQRRAQLVSFLRKPTVRGKRRIFLVPELELAADVLDSAHPSRVVQI